VRLLISPILILLGFAANVNGQDPKENPAERLRQMRTMAEEITMKKTAGAALARLGRLTDPVYRFDDAARHVSDGTVWIWGESGRPSAVMTLTKHRPPSGDNHWLTELTSMASDPITGTVEGFGTWEPPGAGVVMQKFPKAPIPADDATKRLRQMKDLVRQIKAHETSRAREVKAPEQPRPAGKAAVKRYELRVLPQPVYRYADAKSGLIDGAMFLIAYGLNPELVLLVEASRDGSSEPAWHCGFARISVMDLQVDFEGKELWSHRGLSSTGLGDRYCLFTRPIVDE
jgi:hypothetical protein